MCRHNINTVQESDIFSSEHADGIIPDMGRKRWEKFVEFRRGLFAEREQIVDPYQLMAKEGGIDRVAETIVENWMPFFAFVPVDPPPWSRA
jgi:hypothetical protein